MNGTSVDILGSNSSTLSQTGGTSPQPRDQVNRTPAYNGNGLITNEVLGSINTYVNFWTLFLIACFGLVTNSLTMTVFLRQGFREGVNRSMMSITFWDLTKCICGTLHRMFGPLSLVSPGLSVSWLNVTLPYVEYSTLFAGYVSYALTAYVSAEQALSVSRPFAVKSILTPAFTTCMVITISLSVFGAYFVMFFIYVIQYDYSPTYNATIAIYVYSSFYFATSGVVIVYYQAMAILLPFLSFVILCICSAVTFYHLHQSSSKFRNNKFTRSQSASSVTVSAGMSKRDRQVARMLLMVITVNICNLFPRAVLYVAQLVEPEFYLLKRYHNIFFLTTRLLTILDFIKASVNFFIFYNMSSNFRSTFLLLFNRTVKKQII